MLDDEDLARMIRDAHRTTLSTPLSTVVGRRRVPWQRFAMTATAAAVIAVSAVGAVAVLGTEGDPPAGPVSVLPTGKPPRPSSTASAPHDRCVEDAQTELLENGLDALPPQRFDKAVVPGELELLMFADDDGDVACWLSPDHSVINVRSSDLTTAIQPPHPAGELTNSSSAYGQEPVAAYSFGRVPPGTTKVEIMFPDGGPETADLQDGWYLYTATGEAAHRLSEVTSIVATVNGMSDTLPITHG